MKKINIPPYPDVSSKMDLVSQIIGINEKFKKPKRAEWKTIPSLASDKREVIEIGLSRFGDVWKRCKRLSEQDIKGIHLVLTEKLHRKFTKEKRKNAKKYKLRVPLKIYKVSEENALEERETEVKKLKFTSLEKIKFEPSDKHIGLDHIYVPMRERKASKICVFCSKMLNKAKLYENVKGSKCLFFECPKCSFFTVDTLEN